MDISAISGMLTGSTDQARINKEKTAAESFEATLEKAVRNVGATDKEKTELKRACMEFESYFINLMFKEMRKTTFTNEGILPKSFAEETFQEMLDEEYSKTAAGAGGIGLADMMYEQLSKNL